MQEENDEETTPIKEGDLKEWWVCVSVCVCKCVQNVQHPPPDISCSLSSITVGGEAPEAGTGEGSGVLGVGVSRP